MRASIKQGRQVSLIHCDYLVFTVPAPLLRRIPITPALPAQQHEAIASLKYGRATRTLLQFSKRFWRGPGRPRAFGSALPFGAVWEGNEEQRGRAGILSLLSGASASDAVAALGATEGPGALARSLEWLGSRSAELVTCDKSSGSDPARPRRLRVLRSDIRPVVARLARTAMQPAVLCKTNTRAPVAGYERAPGGPPRCRRIAASTPWAPPCNTARVCLRAGKWRSEWGLKRKTARGVHPAFYRAVLTTEVLEERSPRQPARRRAERQPFGESNTPRQREDRLHEQQNQVSSAGKRGGAGAIGSQPITCDTRASSAWPRGQPRQREREGRVEGRAAARPPRIRPSSRTGDRRGERPFAARNISGKTA